jgi:MFS family permease
MSNQTNHRRLAPFVLLQASSFIGFASGSMVFMLMPWLAITLTGQASAAGLAVTITSIPGLLLSPIVGGIIDKYGRRRSAIFIEFVNAAVTVAIPVWALLTGEVNFAFLIAIMLIRSAVGSGGATARKSLIPDAAAAGGISLERANSIHESIVAAGFALGPALASLCIQWMGADQTFWVVATLGALSGVSALLIKVVEHREEHDDDEGRHWVSYSIQGFKILFSTPTVLLLMATMLGLAVIYLPTEMVVLPALYNAAKDPQGLGFLISTMAIFTTAGSLAFEKITKHLSYSTTFRLVTFSIALSMIPMAFFPPQWAMLICGAILGFGWGPLPPLVNTVIQRKIPASKRGRVFSLEMTIWTAGPMTSMSLVGWGVDVLGGKIMYAILTSLVLAAAIFVSTRKNLKDLNRADFDA